MRRKKRNSQINAQQIWKSQMSKNIYKRLLESIKQKSILTFESVAENEADSYLSYIHTHLMDLQLHGQILKLFNPILYRGRWGGGFLAY